MKNKNFVLNLEYTPGGSESEPAEMVIKGTAFTHKRVSGTSEQPDSIENCLVIAIERQPLIDFYNADPGLAKNTDGTPLDSPPQVETFNQLTDFTEDYDGWDPDDIYCAVVVRQGGLA